MTNYFGQLLAALIIVDITNTAHVAWWAYLITGVLALGYGAYRRVEVAFAKDTYTYTKEL